MKPLPGGQRQSRGVQCASWTTIRHITAHRVQTSLGWDGQETCYHGGCLKWHQLREAHAPPVGQMRCADASTKVGAECRPADTCTLVQLAGESTQPSSVAGSASETDPQSAQQLLRHADHQDGHASDGKQPRQNLTL